jgi:hypothetical protein
MTGHNHGPEFELHIPHPSTTPMKRFIILLLTGVAIALGTASTAEAGDRGCRSYSYGHGHSHGYSHGHSYGYRSYSSGYCAPRVYYRSYNYCPPTYNYRSYNSCQPRYYSRSYGYCR